MQTMFSYVLALFASFVAAISQLLLKKAAGEEHKGKLGSFFNVKVILGYGLLFLTTILNVIAYKTVPLKYQPMIDSTAIIWVIILAAVFLKEEIWKKKKISIVLIMLGLLIYSL